MLKIERVKPNKIKVGTHDIEKQYYDTNAKTIGISAGNFYGVNAYTGG